MFVKVEKAQWEEVGPSTGSTELVLSQPKDSLQAGSGQVGHGKETRGGFGSTGTHA